MAKSKAKKKRMHEIRNGGRDVTINQAGGTLVVTRYDVSNRFSQKSTPTLKERRNKKENKYGKNGIKRGDYAS